MIIGLGINYGSERGRLSRLNGNCGSIVATHARWICKGPIPIRIGAIYRTYRSSSANTSRPRETSNYTNQRFGCVDLNRCIHPVDNFLVCQLLLFARRANISFWKVNLGCNPAIFARTQLTRVEKKSWPLYRRLHRL